ncbi:SDR family oxidoreductase [Oerskovia sp. M15]
MSIYSATKSAVDRLTRVAAMESGKLGYGVRVNCVYPGLVPTAMGAGLASDMASLGLFGSAEEAVGAVVDLTPSGRLGTVEDIADAVVFLASDAARFVNGAAFRSTAEWECEATSEPGDVVPGRRLRRRGCDPSSPPRPRDDRVARCAAPT